MKSKYSLCFQSSEPTPRKEAQEEEQEEDFNKKLHDERLAESHRRMLDELALLEQRRKVNLINMCFLSFLY